MPPFYSVADARRRARRVLPRVVFDFVEGGADDELTMRENRRAFEEITFRPRVAVHARPDLRTTVVGTPVELPVLCAPCGFVRIVHPDGEIAVAREAAAAGTVSIVSTAAGTALEEVAEGARTGLGGDDAKRLWFQLYFMNGRAGAEVLVERAEHAGYGALVVTLDTATVGNRERDTRNGVVLPLGVDARNAWHFGPQMLVHPAWFARFVRDGMRLDFPNSVRLGPGATPIPKEQQAKAIVTRPPTWADVEWIRARWTGPLLLKGVLTVDDARRAVDVGADAVVVSNHGGRQLDGAPASVRVLPEVVDAVGADTEVLVDGGVRRGSDVVKAVALGARAVLIGRAYLYGLAARGGAGVADVLRILRLDMDRTMRLLGCPSVQELDRTWIDAPSCPTT
ncbi:MAG TPA: alpha-hydroxy acid oxidase [Acidimicrobiia bacterium]|nr:alpha-hydroxy acid oxidase [Acidimicrobiia bacterium]